MTTLYRQSALEICYIRLCLILYNSPIKFIYCKNLTNIRRHYKVSSCFLASAANVRHIPDNQNFSAKCSARSDDKWQNISRQNVHDFLRPSSKKFRESAISYEVFESDYYTGVCLWFNLIKTHLEAHCSTMSLRDACLLSDSLVAPFYAIVYCCCCCCWHFDIRSLRTEAKGCVFLCVCKVIKDLRQDRQIWRIGPTSIIDAPSLVWRAVTLGSKIVQISNVKVTWLEHRWDW